MSDDRPARRPFPVQPLYDSLCFEFAARELTDDKLAETVTRWAR